MPSLHCPRCGASDLHAVDVELVALNPLPSQTAVELAHKHETELACKQCGWTPSAEAHPGNVVAVTSIDDNV